MLCFLDVFGIFVNFVVDSVDFISDCLMCVDVGNLCLFVLISLFCMFCVDIFVCVMIVNVNICVDVSSSFRVFVVCIFILF